MSSLLSGHGAGVPNIVLNLGSLDRAKASASHRIDLMLVSTIDSNSCLATLTLKTLPDGRLFRRSGENSLGRLLRRVHKLWGYEGLVSPEGQGLQHIPSAGTWIEL